MCAGCKRSAGWPSRLARSARFPGSRRTQACRCAQLSTTIQIAAPAADGEGDEGASMAAAGGPEGLRDAGPYGLRDGAVRRCLLAVSVLHDLDLSWDDAVRSPAGDGLPDVRVDGPVPLLMTGTRLADLLGDDVPDDAASIERVARYLRMRRRVAELSPASLLVSLRAVGLPADHVLHPGTGWVRSTVPGGALSLGLGLL